MLKNALFSIAAIAIAQPALCVELVLEFTSDSGAVSTAEVGDSHTEQTWDADTLTLCAPYNDETVCTTFEEQLSEPGQTTRFKATTGDTGSVKLISIEN